MKNAEHYANLIDFLTHIQSTLSRELMPSDYIQAAGKGGYPDLETIIEEFGPWPEVMKQVRKRNPNLFEKDIVETIKQEKYVIETRIREALEEYGKERGIGISIDRYEAWRASRHHIPQVSEIRAAYGSWEKACHEAGLDPRVRYGEAELIYALKKAKQSLGEDMTCSSYRAWAVKEGAPSPKAFLRRYGTWSNAVSAILMPSETCKRRS